MTPNSSGCGEGIAPIASMPLEIVNMICNELADSPADLARLGQTCRGFKRIVEPIMYQEIEDHGKLRAESLMLTLLADPACGKHIRSMKLRDWALDAVRDPDYFRDGLFDPVLRSLFGVDAEEPKEQHRNLVTIMALIRLAPNLRTLEFCASNAWDNTDILLNRSQTTGRITSPKRTLEQLTNLTITFHETIITPHYGGINLHKLRGLLRSTPNLTSLTIHNARGGTSLAAPLPHLTTLRLNNAYLCTRGLRMLIRKSRSLTHFELTYDVAPHRSCPLPVAPAEILELLAPCRATLQRLHLGVYTPSFAQTGPFPLIQALAGFSALEQITIDTRAIVPRGDCQELVELVKDCRGLQGFFLMGVEGFPRAEFARFVRGATDMVMWPQLSMVKIKGGSRGNNTTQRIYQELREGFQARRPGDDASRIRQSGVELVAVSGYGHTSPFAEN